MKQFLILLFSVTAGAQIYSGSPVLLPTGQAVANASIAVCSANPGSATPPCSSLAQTFTDETLMTGCTLSPSTPGPVSGAGCTNPGVTDSLGNWTVYVQTPGNYWAQTYGARLTPNVLGFTVGGTTNIVNPLIITAGASGDTDFDSLRLTMQNSGEFDYDWLKKDGTLQYNNSAFYPWFQFPFQNQGWVDNKYTVTFFQYAGGIQSIGRGAFIQMNDPNLSTTTLTHNGAGSTGDSMTLRFVDTNSGVSLPITIVDASGYPTPDSSHTNTLCWLQPGGYSNAVVGRGSDPQTVLNIPGSGVLSGQTAGETQAPTCFTDNGSYSTTSLETLMGANFWPNPDRNTTDSLLVGGILFAQDALNVSGGANLMGAVDLQQVADPPAPSVTVNTTGSNSYYYALVYHDYVHIGTASGTLIGASRHITNGAAMANNTVSWNCYPFSYSVDVVRSTDNATWFSLPSSLGLPCSSNNNPNGYASPGNATFLDSGGSTTAYPTPARNATADLYVPGNIEADPAFGGTLSSKYINATNNISGLTLQATDQTANAGIDGYFQAAGGSATANGGFTIYAPHSSASIPIWGCGGSASTTDETCLGANNGTIALQDTKAVGLVYAGGGTRYPLTLNSSFDLMFNGHILFSAAGVVAPAALGSGSPSASTALYGDSSYQTTAITSSSSAGHATCWKTTTTISYCTSVVASDGTCTCN